MSGPNQKPLVPGLLLIAFLLSLLASITLGAASWYGQPPTSRAARPLATLRFGPPELMNTNAYSQQLMPGQIVNVYQYHSSLPAPVGITDYGVLNQSGSISAYTIDYSEVIGSATIYAIQAYNATPPAGVPPDGASLQLNVVLQVNTTGGTYAYWLQDVVGFYTNEDQLYFVDNVWNLSSNPSVLSGVWGNGQVYQYGGESFYAYATNNISYTLPLSLQLVIAFTANYTNGTVNVGFGYTLGGSAVTWYDNVTIYTPNATSAALVVTGNNYTPNGLFYDAELVFGGDGGGEATNFTAMNATLNIEYVLPNSSVVSPPGLYNFGSNTAEAADDLAVNYVSGAFVVTVGNETLGPVSG